MAKHWMEKATERMKAKGTLGSFGKATEKKIAAGKRAGGKMAKKAVFAENAKHAAMKKHMGAHEGHDAVGSHTGHLKM